jgi:recombinational DNA repair protein (RecF pathway)
MRNCLGCHESLPLTDFAYHQRALFCDDCRWSGTSQEQRAEAKLVHERNRRKRLRAILTTA